MAFQLGMDAVLNYSVDDGLTWTPIAAVKDATLNMQASEADVSTRGGAGWKAIAAALREATIEAELLWDPADPGVAAIRDAFLGGTPIGLQALDAAGTGEGLQADFVITSFARNESLEDAQTASITAKATHSATPPQWLP